jgi:protein dithiol oxidoreductase (disulfide-forming)
MHGHTGQWVKWSWAALVSVFLLGNGFAWADLQGDYQIMEKEPSQHEQGKVILFEFADFYCPHCHMFDRVVGTKLKKEFGDKLEIRMIGFPVIPGKLPTAFEMYEQARKMGKGDEMKQVLFTSIHDKDIHVFDKTIRSLVIKAVGLDVAEFEKGLATGQPFRSLELGKEWGQRIEVTHTPTVVLDGNIRIANLTYENLKTVIQSILDREPAT